ncbi:hypothetical protein [uncultured Chryseobacterium sp.]|uniref:hypothetical protein n=1 Tax=uncultured Chryseobacterium sp. TaxID=259322 RepID=UPI0025FB2DD0|nr:hypothetical protein [uncultured Chryseobacterium sp.]
MNIKNLMICFLLILIASCTKKNVKISIADNKVKTDTLKSIYSHPKSKHCSDLAQGYYKRFGILISNFYEVGSFIPYDFNNDGATDTIAILNPFTSIPMTRNFSECYSKEINDRLLVFIKNDGSESRIYRTYANVISNEISATWEGGEFLRSEKDGFSLIGDKGQGCKFEYDIFIKQTNNEFFLNRIKMSFYCPNQKIIEKKYNYRDEKISLKDYKRNIIDSLKIINNF